MIKTALKHFIYEICIDAFFNSVQYNFIEPRGINFSNISNMKLNIGDRFSKIIKYKDNNFEIESHCFGCEIMEIDIYSKMTWIRIFYQKRISTFYWKGRRYDESDDIVNEKDSMLINSEDAVKFIR